MRSRTIAAVIFGLIFGIIFALISLFTPVVVERSCPNLNVQEQQYQLLSISFLSFTTGDASACANIDSVKSIGFPFATKSQHSQNPVPYGQAGVEFTNMDFKTGGFLLNLMIYWAFGFLFFFIFSPSRSPKAVARRQYR